ncbi:pentatricopeptide repeat-containing protein [Pyrus ussuriensis x Pyrus communis]|uniref:Pentatricopeptide repeat-containing protein n=1 Tax=Pyrus ussuriensis x Pyrus communis TaxID=2448454 RepID=A0A5N5G6Q2_9ROSA|nr:pentatricopeptide repeat-containing protein [Pyrus ussuriensis x Pyrus communis]
MLPASSPPELQELCTIVSSAIGGLDDLESSLNEFSASLTSSLVTQVIDSCKSEAPTRRLLRFFSWCHKNLGYGLQDKDYNYGIRVFAEKKDHTAMNIVLSDLVKAGRVMEAQTFGLVTEALVKLGKEDEALGMFKNLDKYKCPQDGVTVTAIVNALCAQGHAKRAEGVVLHHRDKIAGIEPCIYKSLLYGWSVQENVKEARKIIKEMKSIRIMPDLFCYNTFLRGFCLQYIALGVYCPVYDVLIPEFCRGGDLEKGRELWDEAVFKPARNEEKLRLIECTNAKAEVKVRRRTGKTKQTKKKRKILRGMLKKKKKSAAT